MLDILGKIAIPSWVKFAVPAVLLLAVVLLTFAYRTQVARTEAATERADAADAKAKLLERAMAAHAKADEKQELRNAGFEKSQADLANTSSPSDYLRRLRAQQQAGGDPPTAR